MFTKLLSWGEIRARAAAFAISWENESGRELADTQSFWTEFFEVFDLKRRSLAVFEERVKSIKGTYNRIDLFYPGKMLVEQKSVGESLEQASSQAFSYIIDLLNEGRQDEVPRHVIVSDFQRLVLYDLEPELASRYEDQKSGPLRAQKHVIKLTDLSTSIRRFAFLRGDSPVAVDPEDPANIIASQKLGALHDELKKQGYVGSDLEQFLARILFCLFAEDTNIFEETLFRRFIEDRTTRDGSDTGAQLERLFRVLDTPYDKRQRNLDEILSSFPYVNGHLFTARLDSADFDTKTREALIECTKFDWSKISPAIFGALFQSVMDKKERREHGSHYTNERDIYRVLDGLFLNDLKARLTVAKASRRQLQLLHEEIQKINIFDPACGCGNFLVIAYKELRLIETQILKILHGKQKVLNILPMIRVSVQQMTGIDILEFPTRIAEVALWIVDHQMNIHLGDEFGLYFARLPLDVAPNISRGNALTCEWKKVLDPEKCTYIVGNPPFVGGKNKTACQKKDSRLVTAKIKGDGLLDYVAAWFVKAADYMEGTDVTTCFVSTSSLVQGEQVGVLWDYLLKTGVTIKSAHQSFGWESEAKGAAHVSVVVIEFDYRQRPPKFIVSYNSTGAEILRVEVKNISPYLTDGPNVTVRRRSSPLHGFGPMGIGNKPVDGGYFLFTKQKKTELIRAEPLSATLFKRWYGAKEVLTGRKRYCLYVGDCSVDQLAKLPEVIKILQKVKEYRQKKGTASSLKLAEDPKKFHVSLQLKDRYLAIPITSTEKREYVPLVILDKDTLPSNLLLVNKNADLLTFGVLSSALHMAWLRAIGGTLESRLRYSAKVVYNNFPRASSSNASLRLKNQVVTCARLILKERENHNATLEKLYDPILMPSSLLTAHARLDAAVDKLYGYVGLNQLHARLGFLLSLYAKQSTNESGYSFAGKSESDAKLRNKIPSRRRTIGRRRSAAKKNRP